MKDGNAISSNHGYAIGNINEIKELNLTNPDTVNFNSETQSNTVNVGSQINITINLPDDLDSSRVLIAEIFDRLEKASNANVSIVDKSGGLAAITSEESKVKRAK